MNKLFSILLICFFLQIQLKAQHINKDFNWLIGTWQAIDDTTFFEEWKLQSDTSLVGRSFRQFENNIIEFEIITIIKRTNQIFYIPVVPQQNEGQTVIFTLTDTTDGYLFENKLHDFPQIITYKKLNNDRLIATLQGVSGGTKKQIIFNFRQVNINNEDE